MAKHRRRQAGEGSISEYQTKAGPRFLIKYSAQREDGTRRVVQRLIKLAASSIGDRSGE